ncbi:hypothetical protein BC477_08870 [Clavibacter michiganensis subsp. michiganensis]|uniref:Uncharacterized protein n=1 Tax=Clavibacter michiganensis subsp. michiganensis TaxID=33013 RepID=A0A251XN35_CLAMM|nr:hypothetical protein BC477_08870 [Clavibacter michiganensis subsp. michiganensis]OUE04836.1 hypothetical protein CMMCAS07_07795 [Clavibacter michiganensis subsp. michiganensis]
MQKKTKIILGTSAAVVVVLGVSAAAFGPAFYRDVIVGAPRPPRPSRPRPPTPRSTRATFPASGRSAPAAPPGTASPRCSTAPT